MPKKKEEPTSDFPPYLETLARDAIKAWEEAKKSGGQPVPIIVKNTGEMTDTTIPDEVLQGQEPPVRKKMKKRRSEAESQQWRKQQKPPQP